MPIPSIDFLLDASLRSLQDLELAAHNRASNLAKGLKVEIDEWIEQEATALLARWMLTHRETLLTGKAIGAGPHKADSLLDKRDRKSA